MTPLGNENVKTITEIWVEQVSYINQSLTDALSRQQALCDYSLDTWQAHNQYILNRWLERISLFYTQSLTTRERMGHLLEAYLRGLQVLTITKDEKFFETAETLQAGVQSNSKRVAKLFTP